MRRFTVDDYHRMIEAGVFAPDERTELLDGKIFQKSKGSPPHASFLTQVREVIGSYLPPDWRLRVQSGITLSTSELEPDLVIVRGQAKQYRTAHPGPSDIALVVEVADSSLDQDRNVKGPIYARDALPIYWIVNIVDLRLEVYTYPTGPADQPCYQQCRHSELTDSVDLVIAGQVVATIPVADLLG